MVRIAARSIMILIVCDRNTIYFVSVNSSSLQYYHAVHTKMSI